MSWIPRRLVPASLAGRTAFVLVLGLMVVQAAGLTIHALDRVDLERLGQAREVSSRIFGLWRSVVLAPPDRREAVLDDIDLPVGLTAAIQERPIVRPGMPAPPVPAVRLFRLEVMLAAPPRFRPREVLLAATPQTDGMLIAFRLPEGEWLNMQVHLPPPRPWHSETFLSAFAVMTIAAMIMALWATRRLTRPVVDLARAAERLGRDVNAPPLPEDGPREVGMAAHAFNTMASRIRRFVGDRTQLLAAIGHDLRTPITRLRLRAEFMEDEEQHRKMLADLDEMEAMINATLAFARDDAAAEPSVALDLAALARTVLDEAADARPELAERLHYEGPDRLTVRVRPVALKRALANLVGNAMTYGGAARIRLSAPGKGLVRLAVEDDGPGIPEEQMEAMFQPFRRMEGSRNRETGGVGLGLPIARNIFRAHGGDITLHNRAEGGLMALGTLPA